MFHAFKALAAAALLFAAAPAQAQVPQNLEDYLYLDLKTGRVAIELLPDLAPRHVDRAKRLARDGFYDGIVFHRVIEGFMAQSGDPTGTGRGGSDLGTLPAEFSLEPFTRGTVGAARTSDPDSANSQFFICFDDCGFLNGQYTVWGRVAKGMEHVDQIKRGAPGSGAVTDPDRIVSMQVAADASDHSVFDD